MDTFVNYSNYRQPEDIKRLKFIVKEIAALKNKNLNVLDVGCGNGNISFQIANYGHTVKGIDMSPDAIAQAKINFSHPNLTFENKPAEALASGELFDLIVCSEVIEHLEKPEIVLSTIYKILKDDGVLILTVPNGKGPRERFMTKPIQNILMSDSAFAKLFRKFKESMGYKGYTPQSASADLMHIQFFTLKDLKKLADTCGFKIEKVGTSNFIEKVFPFSIISRMSVAYQRFDCWLADYIPKTWTSGFNTIMRKK